MLEIFIVSSSLMALTFHMRKKFLIPTIIWNWLGQVKALFFLPLKLLQCWTQLFLMLLTSLFCVSPVMALPSWSMPKEIETLISFGELGTDSVEPEQLQEISPPKVVQKIREDLNKYHPKLSLVSPISGSVLKTDNWELVLDLQDWPIGKDPLLGLGPHVVVQIDNLDPIRISESKAGKLRLTMSALTPGSHRLVAYAAFPWGEAVKEHGAKIQWNIHFFQKLEGTQPEIELPWLTIVSPSELSLINGPLFIDWVIWNAPLQGLKEGDDQWRVKVSVNGDSFLMDHFGAVWLNTITSKNDVIQIELLDELGNPIAPTFNNQLKVLKNQSEKVPNWLSNDFSDIEISKLAGQFQSEFEVQESYREDQLEKKEPTPFALDHGSENEQDSSAKLNDDLGVMTLSGKELFPDTLIP